MSVGLVLEGGGMRGTYTAGALECFLDEGVSFPYVIGVSAGACNATGFIAGQQKRNYNVLTKHILNPRYLSVTNLVKVGSLFDYDFIVDELPKGDEPFDYQAFFDSKVRFLTGTTNLVTGRPTYFEKDEYLKEFTCLKASCSIPFVSHIVRYRGMELLDGGVADPVPIEKSISDGNEKNVVILTRHAGYRKGREFPAAVVKAVYGRYPNFVEVMLHRDEIYNRQLDLCDKLAREGSAVVIRPQQPLEIDRYEKNPDKLKAAYHIGYRDAQAVIPQIKALFA